MSEIHVMEVEFLSNMRYTLYASHEEWQVWHDKLSRFWDYFDRASKTPLETSPPSYSTLSTPGLTHSYMSPLSINYAYASPTVQSANSPMVGPVRTPQQLPTPPYFVPSVPAPVPRMPDVNIQPGSRKRSYDDALEDHRAKRVARGPASAIRSDGVPALLNGPCLPSFPENPAVRLPMPNFHMSSNHIQPPAVPYTANLPHPAIRAMASVYGQNNQQNRDMLKPQPHALPTLGIY